MHSVRLDKLILAVSAAAATSLTCGHETEVAPVDWDAELPYWNPCGQFKTWETCPLDQVPDRCHWEKELNLDDRSQSDIGCLAVECEATDDCNPQQECRLFNVASDWGVGPWATGEYEKRHYCWPLWPDEVTP